MSSTVWLKFKNSTDGSEITLEDDYVAFTKALTRLADVCNKNGVEDINNFVSYDEASRDFEDELDGAEIEDVINNLLVYKIIETINAIKSSLSQSELDDANKILEKCDIYKSRFDVVCLVFIM